MCASMICVYVNIYIYTKYIYIYKGELYLYSSFKSGPLLPFSMTVKQVGPGAPPCYYDFYATGLLNSGQC